MVLEKTPIPMNRNINRQILCMLLDAFGQDRDLDYGARIRLRQAIYIHGIVDVVLNDQVSRLPESSRSWVRGRRLGG